MISNRNTGILITFLIIISILLIVPASFAGENDTSDNSQEILTADETDGIFLEPAQQKYDTIYADATAGTENGTGNSDSPVSTIAEALNRVNDGGTIYLNGEFAGDGNVNLTFNGTPSKITFIGSKNAVIDGKHNSSFAIVSKGTYSFTNISIINNFKSGYEEFGGAIYNGEGRLTFTNCIFENNTIFGVNKGNGGVIDNSGHVTFRNCTFKGNVANVTNSSAFRKNSADGGAISNIGTLYVYDCRFIENKALRNGGAIRTQDNAYTLIDNCNFTRNVGAYHMSGGSYGGAIYTWDCGLELYNSIFKENRVYDASGYGAHGGAISLNRASGDINILYCQFINNTADGIKTVDGQSIYFDSVEANVNYCTIDTSIYCGSQSVDLNYNWWVVNNTDLDSLIETLPPAAAIKTFAELKISSDAEDIEIGKPVNVLIKLCWNGTENQDNIDLIPIRTAYLDSIGGSISPSSGDLINGLLNTSFMPTSKDILITANVDGVIAASDLSNDDGSAISIYANDISEGEDAAIAITLKNNQSGICLIDIGNGRYYAEIINGSGNVSISGLKAGTYEVIVKFLADDTIASNRKLTVKENPNPENRKDTKIEVESSFSRLANDYTAGERGEYFYAVLKDADGNLLANKTVQIAVNGPVYNVTTDDKGRAGLQVNLAVANTYTYALSFAGDNQYNGAPLASSKLTVTKKPTSISATSKAFKSSAKTKSISVTLKTVKNKDGKTYLRKGKKLTLKVNGKTYTVKTNAKGIAKFSIKLSKKGKFNALIKFAGDKTYKSSAKTVKITIK